VDLAFACKSICGHDLKRPHITCLYCRMRRMRYGKIPKAIKVQIYYIAVQIESPRRFARAKDILFGRLLNLAEFLAT